MNVQTIQYILLSWCAVSMIFMGWGLYHIMMFDTESNRRTRWSDLPYAISQRPLIVLFFIGTAMFSIAPIGLLILF